jgi:outer membrane immunogenic protein
MRSGNFAKLALVALAGVICTLLTAGPAPAQFTGFSAGISGGFGGGTSTQTDGGVPCSFFGSCQTQITCPPDEYLSDGRCYEISGDGHYRMSGGLIGAGASYNFWQTGAWVFGITGDASWADITGSSSTCGASSPFPHACGTTLQSLDTVRGTVGYAFLPNWMIYGTGGYAGGELNAWDQLTGVSGSRFTSGWTAGAGLQVLVSSNVSFKAEYLHVDLRSSTLFDIVPGVPETVGFTGDIFRIGLNWQFNTYAAPPAAQPYYTK